MGLTNVGRNTAPPLVKVEFLRRLLQFTELRPHIGRYVEMTSLLLCVTHGAEGPFVGRAAGRMLRHPSCPSELQSERKICACAVAEVLLLRRRLLCIPSVPPGNFASGLAARSTEYCIFSVVEVGIGFVRGRFRTQIELSSVGNYGLYRAIGNFGKCDIGVLLLFSSRLG